MGAVWLAEQHEPVHRLTALKLIRAGMDSANVVSRFSSERQALALMQHPAIAHVFDAGTTPDGRPYFVMEYIKGVPITDYCDAKRLSIRQRLELFITICDGIQHAHQKAILHRDLKPSNVLVMEQDGKPVVKIIDFGLAKAIGTTPSEIAQTTMAGEVVGTPRYMSPEQLDFSPDGVDTRTDVYSLGVMLYELLTGTTPHSDTRAFDELLSHIREGDVSPPSTRFAKVTESSNAAAVKCGATPESLRKQLTGDLDWIAVKALATDREERYNSASEFAADIVRHLRDEPVQARRPSASYRVAKFVKRNRLPVALAGLVATLIVGLAVTMTIQTLRIARERDRANHEAETTRRIAQFLTRMFRVSDPSEARGNSVTAREILDKAASEIESNLKQNPEVRGQLLSTMGDTYLGLGLNEKGKSLLERAVKVQTEAVGDENQATLHSMSRLGVALSYLGKNEDAERVLHRTLEGQRRSLGAENEEVLATTAALAETLSRLGRHVVAEELLRETIRLQIRLLGPESPATLRSHRSLSLSLFLQRKDEEAERQIRPALALHRRVLGADHPGTLFETEMLGITMTNLGRHAEAQKIQEEKYQALIRVLGPDHPNTTGGLSNLAFAYLQGGQTAHALTLYRQAWATQLKVLGPDHPQTWVAQAGIGAAYLAGKDYPSAEKMLQQVLEKRQHSMAPGHTDLVEAICVLAQIRGHLGKHAEAEKLMQEAAKQAQVGEGQGLAAMVYYYHSMVYALSAKREEAFERLEQSVVAGLKLGEYDPSQAEEFLALKRDPRFEALMLRLRSAAATPAK